MKFFMILLLILLCTYVGYGFSKYYINRHDFWKEMKLFLNKVNLDINFSREKLKPIIHSYTAKSKELQLLLKNFILCLDEGTITEKALFAGIKLLFEDEKNILFPLFKNIGHFDLQGQTKQLENYIEIIDKYQKDTETEKNKFAPLFTKLGLIIGVVISLILL